MVSGKNLYIGISEEDRRSLKSWQHSEVVSSAMANRARVILLLADLIAYTYPGTMRGGTLPGNLRVELKK
jgi:hypothetical protein